ncbi:MAG: efflux RND transporter permease subunit [Firmicutes bacterium]|jgi:HAE1 family hydrophobic/amphiphilic exporter-1|nr:efflux RND transporter permease subunit [Bacillota bacterium]
MKISDMSIKRPVTITMIMLVIILLGIVSLTRLSVNLYPEMDIPVAIVSTSYEGVGPKEIETLISKEIEQSMSTVGGIKTLTSMSNEGGSLVVLEFNYGVDMDSAVMEMREKLDLIRAFLPDDAGKPMVFKINPNSFPIMFFSVNSDMDIDETKRLVEDRIVNRIERLDGVASVYVTGGNEKEVEILLDNNILGQYNIDPVLVSRVIAGENINLPGGNINRGKKDVILRTTGEFKSVKEIGEVMIPVGKTSMPLKNIGSVQLENKDRLTINELNGKESLSISISKQSDYNTVEVANLVNAELRKISDEFEGLRIEKIFDQSEFIKDSIQNVTKNGLLGGIFSVIVLLIFLRNIRSTLIIAVAIPVSVVGTFSLIYFGGISLNMMTLGGLALGMGMLVDNSIVVLENIYRYRSLGYDSMEAARKGVSEVGTAVVASTITSVAVFLPIVFSEGLTSLIFKELAMTVTFSLLASLVVALTFVPMLSSRLLKVDLDKRSHDKFSEGFEKFQKKYVSFLSRAIRHKFITIFTAILLVALSVGLATKLGAVFLPKVDEGHIKISVEMPIGTRIEYTHDFIKEIESEIKDIEEIDTIFLSSGSGGNFSRDVGSNTHLGSLELVLKGLSERDRSSEEVADQIRNIIRDNPGGKIEVKAVQSSGFGGGSGSPVDIKIKGESNEILQEISSEIVELVKGVAGTREISSSVDDGKPELNVLVNRSVASMYGLSTSEIANSVKSGVSGLNSGKYKKNGKEYDIVIRGNSRLRESIYNFKSMNIKSKTLSNVPLDVLADFTINKGPKSIVRENQIRQVNVTADTYNRDLRSVIRDIDKKLKDLKLPSGYSYEFGGENEELVSAFQNLVLAIALAIVLVYMVMASQFESLLSPFIIMFSVPLAISGGIYGLYITSRPISVPALIGVIILAGIVVNNGIVLIDYTNKLRDEGYTLEDAVKKSASTRLRPILMTTLTTILGLLPITLGIGEGAEAIAPLGTVVVFGLILATMLTLVLIPVVYIMFSHLSEKRKIKKIKKASLK